MSGFDVSSLLPFYLDETDEQIVALSDALLKLEDDPTDGPSIRDAFRLIHTIKGSSTVLGFEQVKNLTHHLETYFDRLRSGQRSLDRPTMDLCLRCLDALRDYHRDLRSQGGSEVDLSGLTRLVLERLEGAASAPRPSSPGENASDSQRPTLKTDPGDPAQSLPQAPSPIDGSGQVRVSVRFVPNLPWADMKAKLILTRLGTRGRVLRTEPPAEKLEEAERLSEFSVWLAADCDPAELRSLADVDGVAEVQIGEPRSSEETPPPTATVMTHAAVIRPDVETIDASPPLRSDLPAPSNPPPPSEAVAGRSAGEPRSKITETLRVDVDRLDHLMNLTGELVITKARFVEIANGLQDVFKATDAQMLIADTLERIESLAHTSEGPVSARSSERWIAQLREDFREIQEAIDLIRKGRDQLSALSEAIHHLGRVSDGIQKGVLEIRMVPIGPLFERFHRVIRDLRLSSGKEIALRIDGEKTELDKRMIDELGDPLIHLVRNAVDHGLEPPEQRAAAGKPRSGTVSLAASHRGNSVVITVSDDGRGIDAERVRIKAVDKGLLSEAESHRLSERQLIAYIWHPGLSTAETVTDISGRGVGMDIVKSRIEALNGSVDVRTELGQGTTFVIRLPLTLAILPVLQTRIGGVVYAIPLDHLDEIVEVRPSQIYRVQGRRSIEIRDRIIALLNLREIFRWNGSAVRASDSSPEENSEKYTVVVVSDGEETIGLIVDELLGMQEGVLKSLEKNYRAIPGLSGASILGDGRVSLILDVESLINMTISESDRAIREGEARVGPLSA
jgi:two-component system, chemotaxis family, sensor kinase CheA